MRVGLSAAILTLILMGCEKAPTPPVAIAPSTVAESSPAPVTPLVTIIHVKNWHWLPKEHFAADQRGLNPKLTNNEIDIRYSKFLEDIDALQREQVGLMRELFQQHPRCRVFYEGVTDSNGRDFIDTVQALRQADIGSVQINLEQANRMVENIPTGTTAHTIAVGLRDDFNAKVVAYRDDLLQVGAVGRMLMADELDRVFALDDENLLDAANPVQANGTIEFNPAADAAREDGMAKRLLASTPVVIAVLGGEHDLTDNLQKLSTHHEYVVRETPKYRQLAQGD